MRCTLVGCWIKLPKRNPSPRRHLPLQSSQPFRDWYPLHREPRSPKIDLQNMHSIGLSRAWRLHSLDSTALVVVRHFNMPTGILPNQQVWIELKPLESCQLNRAELNGLEICIKDGLAGGRWLIDLHPNNQLLVEITLSESLLRLLPADKALLDMSMWLSAHLQLF